MRNLERKDEENFPGDRKNLSYYIINGDKQLESLLLTAGGMSQQAVMIALQENVSGIWHFKCPL